LRAAIDQLERLTDAGLAGWTATGPGAYALVIHDYDPVERETVRAFLQSVALPPTLARGGREIVLPLALGFGTPKTPGLNVQTRSVYDLIAMAAQGVEVPPADLERGNVVASTGTPLENRFVVHSSTTPPGRDVRVATHPRGHWFFVAANDGPSKLVFRLLQSLIGMRLVDAAPHGVPTLTIPVK
jgi:hypothetical protein